MFAQPFLIQTVINKVGASGSNASQGLVGGLVGATALVYLGIAVYLTFRAQMFGPR